ncbi:MAG TPA: dTMP kinase [Candidatus Xenobia bacterium]|jgi:dTMP kinase
MKGFFITFEGLEGSGKTTQASRLVAALKEKGYSVVGTREPGGTPIGETLRNIVLDPNRKEMNSLTEVLLFAAIRAQHIAQVIRPMLDEGGIVVCDRFADATLAYQGYGRELHLTMVREVNGIASWGVQPDLTVYLDIEAEQGLARMRRRLEEQENIPDRIEREDREFYEKVRQGYHEISREEPGRFRVFNADQNPEQLHAKILDKVVQELRRRGMSNKLTLDNMA